MSTDDVDGAATERRCEVYYGGVSRHVLSDGVLARHTARRSHRVDSTDER